ncbi:MAG: hypothetical protein V4569_08025 [Pseudomonadota bacterium]
MSRWFPERVVLRVGDRPPAGVGTATPAAPRLESMLAAFERELDARALKPGTRLTCVVAGDGVRYRIVPWSDELAGQAQRQALVEQCFHEAYGDAARAWTVRLHTRRHGAAALACALDTLLLDRLAALARTRRLELVSVQPSLMHAWNQVPRRTAPGLFWFVCIEAHATTLLLMSPTEPLHVKLLPASGIELARTLDREWFALGQEGPHCPLHVVRSEASAWRVVDRQAA